MTTQHDRRHQATDPRGSDDQSGDTAWEAGAVNLAELNPLADRRPWMPQPAATLPAGIRQVVFIDPAVPDAQRLANGVAAGVLAVILSAGADGVDQIAAWLSAHHAANLSAIDIVAHGQDGMVTLGGATLAAGTIAQYASALATIGDALRPGGGIQLYGCDIAQDAAGDAFLQQLAAATGGANVAVASHLVGAASGGGSWTLDVNTGAIDAAVPFTAAAISAYPDELGLTTNQLFVGYQGALASSFSRLEQVGVTGSTAGATSDLIDDAHATNFQNIVAVAVDAPSKQYFLVDNSDGSAPSASGTDNILVGTIGGGAPASIFNAPTSSPADYSIGGLALDQPDGYLYFGYGSDIIAAGIYKINIVTHAVTAVATSSNVLVPGAISLDLADNLVFFTDSDYDNQTTNNIDVGNISTGAVTVLNSQLSSAIQNLLSVNNANEGFLTGLAYDAATKTLFFSTQDGFVANAAADGIFSAGVTISGGTVHLGAVTTLYSGAAADAPISLQLDTQNNLFYIGSANIGSASGVYESSMSGGGFHLVYQETTSTSSFGQPESLALLSTPTIVATGTISYLRNAAATDLDAAASVANADAEDLDGATISVSGGTSSYGDTLSATVAGTSITASYDSSNETLTLSGADTLAHYQQVLDSVAFTSTGATAGTRTIDWSVTDGLISSATATSAITVHDAPVITAGGTVSFTGGGAAVRLDAGLSITDVSSATLASATVVIGGFISADTLTVGSAGGLASSFSNGTLTLSGSASLATYQTALESIDYACSPSNGDPTGGGAHTSRTISWSVNDGTASSSAATSTLDIVHVDPSVTAGAAVTYPEDAAPVILDAGLSATDPDSGGDLSGATVTISSGFLAGDTLTWTDTAGISGSYDATTGVLSFSGTASIATYQSLLQSVAYSFPGDPTNALSDNTRNISWTVTDGAGSSTAVSSSLTVLCFCAGTMIATPDGEVAVECLSAGDLVLTAAGSPRPIVWVGVGRQLVTRGRRSAATPVIVARGALGPNLPRADLRLTRAHALLVDDVLIPVEFLVNHRSIRWDDRAREVKLYHIELESHDVLLANGAPAESYRDDGNRWLFHNASAGWGLPRQAPCAPVLTGGPIVDAAWHRYLTLSGPRKLPPLTDDPDLYLLVGGQRIDTVRRIGQDYVFRLPDNPGPVRIASRDAIPAELGIARDSRPLGVALRSITLRQGGVITRIDADDHRLAEGFHFYEPADRLRWTNGDAALPASVFSRSDGPTEITLSLGGSTRYPLFADERPAAAA